MSGSGDKTDQALAAFTERWVKATACFKATDKPHWKRTLDGMRCFKGLPLDHLPRKLQRRLDTHFDWINSILEPYALQTWDDYQKISTADLARIEKIIDALV